MSSTRRVASRVQALFEQGTLSGLSEAQLLARFARHGDQDAFEALLSRHGPMVMGVCRRILGDGADADDAFQATFLVLIRRAEALGRDDVLAAWLHGVASRVARRARSDRARRERRERSGPGVEPASNEPPAPDAGLRAVIDEELERLPWRYRAPIVLCYLEGLTHEQAARRLDWPLGTVKGRLARARTLLGSRLSRRGVTTAAVAVALEAFSEAAVSDALGSAVARSAARIAEGCAWRCAVSAHVLQLSQGVVTSMFISKLKAVGALMAVVVLMAAGARGAGRGADVKPEGQLKPEPPASVASPEIAAKPVAPDPRPRTPEQDRFLDAARTAFLSLAEEHAQGKASLDRVYLASRLLLDAQSGKAGDDAGRKAALAKHRDRMKTVARTDLDRAHDGSGAPAAEARVLLAEADLLLARSQEVPSPSLRQSPPVEGQTPVEIPPVEVDKRVQPTTEDILKRLDVPLAMPFANETPLEDVLKYIKQSTQTPTGETLPIYIDPVGLNETQNNMISPVSIDLDGVSLKSSLHLLLRQRGLVYYVEGGVIVITSPRQGRHLKFHEPMSRPALLSEQVVKASAGELSIDEMKELAEKLKLIAEIRKLHDAVLAVEPDVPPTQPDPASATRP